MARKPTDGPAPPRPEHIFDEPISEALSRRYLAYALSTITARALPDVRDGLKPVHRRILYAMRNMRLGPDGAFKKSAKVVGEVMGNFHPHGDSAIYDALVRLVQAFSVRVPLIDGQGNFGNIDGDNAAAMRYTESRLTPAAELLLAGIDDDTVDFRPTYDGSDVEPVVLPGAFPNLLANGSSGIAVGMATSIPPHNPAELIDAAIHLIRTPNARIETLLGIVPGPDFPTGGVLVEPPESVLEAYATGRGGFRLRARWHAEDQGRGRYLIVITEIPYQVQKSRLVERLAELIQAKKLAAITDVRDESAEDVRLVLEPRVGTLDPMAVMESVFKVSDLEVRFPLNMNVLDADGTPRVMSIKDCLQAFIDHRRDVLRRGTRYRLGRIAERLEVLGGLLIAYLNLDEVIRIIRYDDDPKVSLIRTFTLTEVQAEAILNMRLRALRKLEEMEIRRENDALLAEQAALTELLQSDELQAARMIDDLKATRAAFDPRKAAGRRRTTIEALPAGGDVDLDALVEREPVTVVISDKGWVRALKGHVEDATTIKYKEGDQERLIIRALSSDRLMLLATNGKFFTLGLADLPGGRGNGEPIRLLIDLSNEDDIIAAFVLVGGRTLLLASSAGHGLFVAEDDAIATTRKGKQVLNLGDGTEAQVCRILTRAPAADDYIAAVGENRKMLVFPAMELPNMARGKGVALQKFTSGGLADAKLFAGGDGLTLVDRAGRVQQVTEWHDYVGRRGAAGRTVPKGFPKVPGFGPDPE